MTDTVLILEDEFIIAMDMEMMLSEAGFRAIHIVDTQTEALEWLACNSPVIAIVDPRLRDGTSAEAARLLEGRGIPFVVYSGDIAGAVGENKVFGSGIWLGKPSTPEQVMCAVRRALAGELELAT